MAEPDVTIRPYRPETDRNAVERVMRLALEAAGAYFTEDVPADGDPSIVFDSDSAARSAFLVAESDGQVVGTGAFRPPGSLITDANNPFPDTVAELKRMHVRPSYQHRGIGTMLLDRLRTLADERGYEEFVLQTTAVQNNAISFYESRDFREVARTTISMDGRDIALLSFRGPVVPDERD